MADRLSCRDLVEEEGEGKVNEMEPWDRLRRIESRRERHVEEFEMNGLGGLRMTDGGSRQGEGTRCE
ncbi:hypothetical protein AMJ39_08695 [candidate division TA06 bacterium DG_24]|uniref:Uncharacterized protein n=1 Tax=candidate division TA06 bacterium DG_24 TaxID=1703770 RepID=A0A0S7WPK2_UNCT6|nr:MAG: hypothetical protein AMJ39_08695 [candidate division TA06 bacterium DG_24]